MHLIRPDDPGAVVPLQDMDWRDRWLPSARAAGILAIAGGAIYRGVYYVTAPDAVGLAFFRGITPQDVPGAFWILFGLWLIGSVLARRFTAVLVTSVAVHAVWFGAYAIADPFVEADLMASGVNYAVIAILAYAVNAMRDRPARRR